MWEFFGWLSVLVSAHVNDGTGTKVWSWCLVCSSCTLVPRMLTCIRKLGSSTVSLSMHEKCVELCVVWLFITPPPPTPKKITLMTVVDMFWPVVCLIVDPKTFSPVKYPSWLLPLTSEIWSTKMALKCFARIMIVTSMGLTKMVS